MGKEDRRHSNQGRPIVDTRNQRLNRIVVKFTKAQQSKLCDMAEKSSILLSVFARDLFLWKTDFGNDEDEFIY